MSERPGARFVGQESVEDMCFVQKITGCILKSSMSEPASRMSRVSRASAYSALGYGVTCGSQG
jgi:hypothetical protein